MSRNWTVRQLQLKRLKLIQKDEAIQEQIYNLILKRNKISVAIQNLNSRIPDVAEPLKTFPVSLYALELEDDCWYVGMTFNVEKRFRMHSTGKGARWTMLHKPLGIHEVRETGLYNQNEVSKLEDDMTIEYALKYGSDKVRGGGWCQPKPHWPEIVKQNEVIIFSA